MIISLNTRVIIANISSRFGFTARLVTAHAHSGRAGAFRGQGEPESVTGEEL